MKKDTQYSEELNDWIDALENLVLFDGKDKAKIIVKEIISHAKNKGLIDEAFFPLLLRIQLRNMKNYHILETGILKKKLDII